MRKSIARILTCWIFYRPWRRVCRNLLIRPFSPYEFYLHRKHIKAYLAQKRKRGKAKTVIYTAIAGGYDKLKSHRYLMDDADYVCFTDQPVKGLHAWEIRPMKEFDHKKPVLRAKYYKFFPDKLFSDYTYSVWIDGSWDITGPYLENKIIELEKSDTAIATTPHPARNCIYSEAQACKRLNKDNTETIEKQVEFLRRENYPENNGLYEMNIIFRKHNDEKIVKLMDHWWEMVINYSSRDQLSFCYVLWKSKIKPVLLFPSQSETIGCNKDFAYHRHLK